MKEENDKLGVSFYGALRIVEFRQVLDQNLNNMLSRKLYTDIDLELESELRREILNK